MQSLYARRSARATLTDTALDRVTIFGFKDSQRGVEQPALRNDDDIKPRRDVVTTENLSYQSFGPVPDNSAAKLLRRGDAQSSEGALVGKDEERDIPPGYPTATLVDFLKLRSPTNTISTPKPGHSTGRRQPATRC